jgi:hypothetical protein
MTTVLVHSGWRPCRQRRRGGGGRRAPAARSFSEHGGMPSRQDPKAAGGRTRNQSYLADCAQRKPMMALRVSGGSLAVRPAAIRYTGMSDQDPPRTILY